MTFYAKRKANRQNGRNIVYIHFTPEDLQEYSPEYYKDYYDACRALERSACKTARQQGYYKREILPGSLDLYKSQLRRIWEQSAYIGGDQND